MFQYHFKYEVRIDRAGRIWRYVNPATSWTIDDERLSRAIDQWLARSLTEREARILRLRYGLDAAGQAHTYAAIGLITPRSPKSATPGPTTSRERVRQTIEKAHRKLRVTHNIQVVKGLVSVRSDTDGGDDEDTR